jgi:hypothetical protein
MSVTGDGGAVIAHAGSIGEDAGRHRPTGAQLRRWPAFVHASVHDRGGY